MKYSICNKKLAIESIVLLYDTKYEKNIFCKLFFKWLELYQICNIVKDKNTYMLIKLDRLQLAGIFVSDKFRKFYSYQ